MTQNPTEKSFLNWPEKLFTRFSSNQTKRREEGHIDDMSWDDVKIVEKCPNDPAYWFDPTSGSKPP